MWTCPKCHTQVDPSFDVCWNCGTSVDGVEDPSFVKADDAGPIESDPVIPELEVKEDVAVLSDLPEPIAGELVEAYQAYDLVEAKFLADELNEAGIQAASDTHDLQHSFGPMDGAPRLWVRAEDLPRARAWLEAYEKNKATNVDE
jgi:Putative prokaryotic signal transducing protein